ncbi:MAG: DUF1217 domain-containing protein [Rhodomicrobium sp.]
MTASTLSTYLQISNNLTKWQNLTASQPEVQQQTAYYQANIGSVSSPAGLVNNYRLFSYVLNAYELGDMSYAKGLFQQVLEQGTGSTNDLAYTLNNPQMLALAQTFDFADNGASATSSAAVQTGVVNNYIQQTLETNQGQSDPGVQLALYFQQNAPNITSVYNILADKNLLTVVQTALGISPLTSAEPIDTQANLIAQKLNINDFQNPKKLQTFIERFAVLYDENNGGTNASQSTGVPNAVLSDSSSGSGFGVSLLSSLQGLSIGDV